MDDKKFSCLETYIHELSSKFEPPTSSKYENKPKFHLENFVLNNAIRTPYIKQQLLPIKLVFNDEYGRFLEVSRDISKGEILFYEKPLVIAPKGGCGPVCLDCCKPLPSTSWSVCKLCKAPKCDKECYGENHTFEECKLLCKVLENNLDNKKNNIKWIKLLNVILTPLRTFIVCQNSQQINLIVNALQSNYDKRKNTSIGNFIDNTVIPFFEQELPDLPISKDFIHHACGTFDTNAFEITNSNDYTFRGLLPLAALMKHSCIPNAHHWYYKGQLVVRASIDIKCGEAITNTYTQSLWGTNTRQAHLRLTKHFVCQCTRCQDPTELGSHISSITCHNCFEGLLVPQLKPMQPWKCENCNETFPSSSINNILSITSGVLAMASSMDAEALFKAIGRLTKMLGINHSSTVQLQLMFVQFVSKTSSTVDTKFLHESLNVINFLLNLSDKIEPGMTNFRGILLHHKMKTNKALMERNFSSKSLSILASENESKKAFLEGEECENIMKFDPLLEEILQLRKEQRLFELSIPLQENDQNASK